MTKDQNIIIHFIQTKQRLSIKNKILLKEMVEKHAIIAYKDLNIALVNITIFPNADFVIPETGECGMTWSSEMCFIYIDPTRTEKELQQIITKQIPGTVYHELNHVARWDAVGKNIGFGTNLTQAIISEGIATVFEFEKWSDAKTPWVEYTKVEIMELLEIYRHRDIKLDTSYNHEEWFYGEGELPRWIGYKLGFYIVTELRKKNTNMDWRQITQMHSTEILKLADVSMQ